MAEKLTISFKDNQEELRLLEYIKSKRNKSDYVKDLIENDMKGKVEIKKDIEENTGGFVW